MQPQKKKSHTVVLLIGWLIILGSYLLIRLAFILFGLHLRSEALGVCLAVIPYLLAALYFGKYGKSQKDIADAYLELVKRGYTSKQAIGSMNTELQGSIASSDEFSDVVEIASQIFEGFGMTVNKNGILHK